MKDYVSYEDAMSQLGLSEDELNELVASGQLRAIHDGDQIRFRSDDIGSVKKSRDTEPTIVLSDTQAEKLGSLDQQPIDLDSLSTDETVLNIEGLLEDSEGTTPVPGAGILEGEDDIRPRAVGDDTVLDTDGLELGDDFKLSADDTSGGEEETLLTGGGVRSMQVVRKQSHAAMTAVLAATVLLALAPSALMLNLITDTSPFAENSLMLVLNPMIDAIMGMF
ncbi:MAG: helix-turn-helix domain-containing protein [Planctomycetota bacterium]